MSLDMLDEGSGNHFAQPLHVQRVHGRIKAMLIATTQGYGAMQAAFSEWNQYRGMYGLRMLAKQSFKLTGVQAPTKRF